MVNSVGFKFFPIDKYCAMVKKTLVIVAQIS